VSEGCEKVSLFPVPLREDCESAVVGRRGVELLRLERGRAVELSDDLGAFAALELD
jgi:hypothetical protein